MTLIEEAQLMAGKLTSKEIDALTEGRKCTDVERIASMFALQKEIEARTALKKAKAAEKGREYDTERGRAERLYANAKEDLRFENERHLRVEDRFAGEKARHKAERELHAKAVAQFKQDAKPWRDIVRAEREAERAIQAEADKGIDDFLAGHNNQQEESKE